MKPCIAPPCALGPRLMAALCGCLFSVDSVLAAEAPGFCPDGAEVRVIEDPERSGRTPTRFAIACFVDDVLDGPYIAFHPNPAVDPPAPSLPPTVDHVWRLQRRAEGGYRRGRRTGEWIFRNADGMVAKHGAYRDGLRTGRWTTFDVDGALRSEGVYRDDRREGAWAYHFPDYRIEEHYARGERHGPEVSYWRAGGKRTAGQWHRGLRDGEWTWWASDGAELWRGRLRRGTGEWTTWWPNGKQRSHSVLKDGVKHGPLTVWHESGGVLARSTFVDGKRQGAYTEFYPDGTRRAAGSYRSDSRHGLWLKYDQAGKLSTAVCYQASGDEAWERPVADEASARAFKCPR